MAQVCRRELTAQAQPQQGFTLIELLVVMVILATLMATVGPLSKAQSERAAAFSEWRQVRQLVERAAKNAYLSGQYYRVELNGKSLKFIDNGSEPAIVADYAYEFVFFPPQSLVFDNHGYSSISSIKARVRQQEMEYRLSTNKEQTKTKQ